MIWFVRPFQDSVEKNQTKKRHLCFLFRYLPTHVIMSMISLPSELFAKEKQKCILNDLSWPELEPPPDNQGYADISIASPSHLSRHWQQQQLRKIRISRPKEKPQNFCEKSDADDIYSGARWKQNKKNQHISILSKIRQKKKWQNIYSYIYIYISACPLRTISTLMYFYFHFLGKKRRGRREKEGEHFT